MKQQWMGGPQPSQADVQALAEIGDTPIDPASHPNLFAWWAMASKFSPKVRAEWPEATAAEPAKKGGSGPKKEAPAPAKKADDDFDPFADEMDDEEKAQMERMKAKAAAAGKGNKKAVIAKSIVLWEVKPWEADTNLDELAKLILDIKMDGLEWKAEYKKEPVAYGVFKLIVGAVVEDEKVSTDDV